jgi:hypothetical protein
MPPREQRVLGAALGANSGTGSSEENSKFRVGDDLYILLDEVLNNSIRALLVYDDFSGRFTDMDACALASVLRYNTSLISVNLCGVDIGDHAVSLLCDALARSKVRVIDLSNTYLADEAGTALAALAYCNPSLRTLVLDDTLIPEELMDDIDLACQLNETKYELPPPLPIDPNRTRYCVQHCFGVCPNGEFCPLTHRSITLIGRDPSEEVSAAKSKPLALPPLPAEGASWKAPKDAEVDPDDITARDEFKPVFGAKKRSNKRLPSAGKAPQVNIALVAGTAALCCSVVLLALSLRSRRIVH